MRRSKIIELQREAHDWEIELRTSFKNGKSLCSTRIAGQICGLIERALGALLEAEISGE